MSVVVGYVPTREGETALEHAVGEARSRGAGWWWSTPPAATRWSTRGTPTTSSSPRSEQRLAGRRATTRSCTRCAGRDASEEILAVAREHRAELVVIGLRRRSPVGKLLMGSTAQRVLLDAACPVLAVKP